MQAANVDESESEDDENEEDDDGSDEDATPPRSVTQKRPAGIAGKQRPAGRGVATKSGGSQLALPPPEVSAPFRGWYSGF